MSPIKAATSFNVIGTVDHWELSTPFASARGEFGR
jgi:hypothetical protein